MDNYQKRSFDKNIGTIHIVDIGGIGMSGIAEILFHSGFTVQGSDNKVSNSTQRLIQKGLKIFIGHHGSNIDEVDIIVKSSAIQSDNVELIEADNKKIPIISRAEILAEIMKIKISIGVTGSHGKTTTTSILASIFRTANLDPTIINGGIMNDCNSNAILGHGDHLIAEIDESDGTFVKVPITAGVMTNLDPEHLDYYGSFDRLKDYCYKFFNNIPFYGFSVACVDHKNVREILKKITKTNMFTYSIYGYEADFTINNIKVSIDGQYFDLIIRDVINNCNKILKQVFLPMHGNHNLQNALAAIAVSWNFGIEKKYIYDGLKKYSGVKRRFTKVGVTQYGTIIDDYAHHPEEIKATMQCAQSLAQTNQRIIVVVQPHRYSRVKDLFSDYVDVLKPIKELFLADIYAAGEKEIEGYSIDHLYKEIKNHNSNIQKYSSLKNLKDYLEYNNISNALIIFMGAGDVTSWAYKFNDIAK